MSHGLDAGSLAGIDGVYLLHLDPPYKHARHYLGYSDDIARRFREHQTGRGSALTEAAVAAGCELSIVRVWPGYDKNDEWRLRCQHNNPRMCPICNTVHDGEVCNAV